MRRLEALGPGSHGLEAAWPDGVRLTIKARAAAGGWRLDAAALAGHGPVEALGARLRRAPGGSRLLVDGYHSWDWTGVRDLSRPGRGWWGGLWGDPGGVAGALALAPAAPTGRGAIVLSWTQVGAIDMTSVGPPAQEPIRTGEPGPLVLAGAARELRATPLLLRPAGGLAGAGAGLPPSPPPAAAAASIRGWMSWNCLGAAVRAADVRQAARELVPRGGVVLLDDGWMPMWGDWRADDGFGADLATLAAELGRAGRRLGLWIAPFLVDPRSAAAADRGALLDGGDGRPAVDTRPPTEQWILDASQERVRAGLADLGRRLGDAGVGVLKLDFLYAGALPGRRAGGADAVAGLRAGLRALVDGFRESATRRGTVGAAVLACGAPGPVVTGIADACRSGGDAVLGIPGHNAEPPQRPWFVHGEATLRAQERNLAARAWLWGATLPCDVDAVSLGPVGDTPSPESPLVERWLRLLRRSGGPRLDADVDARLDPENRAALERFLDEPARPPERPIDPLAMTPGAGDDFLAWQEDVPEEWAPAR